MNIVVVTSVGLRLWPWCIRWQPVIGCRMAVVLNVTDVGLACRFVAVAATPSFRVHDGYISVKSTWVCASQGLCTARYDQGGSCYADLLRGATPSRHCASTRTQGLTLWSYSAKLQSPGRRRSRY